MKRLTIHLKKAKKNRIDGKSYIKNTITYDVRDEKEALEIVNNINQRKPHNNVGKWYLSNK